MRYLECVNLDDCLIQSFDFERIAHLNKSKSYKLRSREDRRLAKLAKRTESIFSANDTMVYDFFTKSEEEQQELPKLLDSNDNSDASDLEENISPITFKGNKRSCKQSNTANGSLKPPTTAERAASPPRPPLRKPRRKVQRKVGNAVQEPTSPISLLRKLGRKREKIIGDGNCYFRCLSQAAVGKPDLHQKFRTKIADIMSEFKYAFEIFSPDGRTYEDHVSAIRNPGAWATQAEIYATATRYQIDICVYTWFGRNWNCAIYKPRFQLNVLEKEKLPFQRIEILSS